MSNPIGGAGSSGMSGSMGGGGGKIFTPSPNLYINSKGEYTPPESKLDIRKRKHEAKLKKKNKCKKEINDGK